MCTWVGGWDPASVPFQSGRCERGISSSKPPSIFSPSGSRAAFFFFLNQALVIAPRGGRSGSGNSWGNGRWTCWCPSVRVSVSFFSPPFRLCIYCIHAAGMFLGGGKQLDAPPWHCLTSTRVAASGPSGHSVWMWFIYKWITFFYLKDMRKRFGAKTISTQKPCCLWRFSVLQAFVVFGYY